MWFFAMLFQFMYMPIAVAVCQQTSRRNSNVNKSIARGSKRSRECVGTQFIYSFYSIYTLTVSHTRIFAILFDFFRCCCGSSSSSFATWCCRICSSVLFLLILLAVVSNSVRCTAWIKLTNWYYHCIVFATRLQFNGIHMSFNFQPISILHWMR